jgi:hypothetical protein
MMDSPRVHPISIPHDHRSDVMPYEEARLHSLITHRHITWWMLVSTIVVGDTQCQEVASLQTNQQNNGDARPLARCKTFMQ